MTSVGGSTMNGPLVHASLPYNGVAEFVSGVTPFLEQGSRQGEPALVFAPRPNVEELRGALHDVSDITFLDAADVARNPARIIPAALRFAEGHLGRRVRVVGEGIWPNRSPAEVREFVRHEALINIFFADIAATILCPFDEALVDSSLHEHARRTHPHALEGDAHRRCPTYVDPAITLSTTNWFTPAPSSVDTLHFKLHDLRRLRSEVRSRADEAGVTPERTAEVVLAASEAAANTLRHTDYGGELRTWIDGGVFVCEVTDRGHIKDAHLTGRLAPPSDAPGGRGLWLMNQLCDLVELRSDASGTIIRLHIGVG